MLKLDTGSVGVFCPDLTGRVDKVNSEQLFVVEQLSDLFPRRQRVRWSEVRGLIATWSAELTGPETLCALQARMRIAIDAVCGIEGDAMPAIWNTMFFPLTPLVINGLGGKEQTAVQRAMQLRFTTQVEQVIPKRDLLHNFFIGRASRGQYRLS